MFRTYYCDLKTCEVFELGEYKTYEEAEMAAQEAYAEDARCGELGERRYAVEDTDNPQDYVDCVVFPDVERAEDEEEDDDEEN